MRNPAVPPDPPSLASHLVAFRDLTAGCGSPAAIHHETGLFAQGYRANAAACTQEFDALDAEIRAAVDALPEGRRTVVVAHNAFRYFEEEYGIAFLSPQGVSTESEASAADVAGLIREIRDTDARAIFAENISDTRLLDRIAAETGLSLFGTLCSDALSGPEGPAQDDLSMMRHNARTIAAALAAE